VRTEPVPMFFAYVHMCLSPGIEIMDLSHTLFTLVGLSSCVRAKLRCDNATVFGAGL